MRKHLRSRNVTINGRRTSLRLEEEFWDGLSDISQREGLTIHELCTLIDRHRHGSSRTSAVRAFIVTYFRVIAGYSGAGSSHSAWMGLLGKMDRQRAVKAKSLSG